MGSNYIAVLVAVSWQDVDLAMHHQGKLSAPLPMRS